MRFGQVFFPVWYSTGHKLKACRFYLFSLFDNCSAQNKNNIVLKLAAWLMAMNYFKLVNFTFLIVGHTKNAADCLFNSLKTKYRLQNLFTFQDLLEALNRLPMVTALPACPEDFLDYNKLMNYLYRPLAGIVKKNHIFSCMDDESQMRLWHSNLAEHNKLVFNLWKRTTTFPLMDSSVHLLFY